MKLAAVIARQKLPPSVARMQQLIRERPDELFDAVELGVGRATFQRLFLVFTHNRVFIKLNPSGSAKCFLGGAPAIKAALKAMPDKAFLK